MKIFLSGLILFFGLALAIFVPFHSASAWDYHVLYVFKGGTDGAGPRAALIDVGGALYGTTGYGGATCSTNGCNPCPDPGCGTVFKITTSGRETVLHIFGTVADGNSPYASLINVGGILYGTTTYGGTSSCPNDCGYGAVFAITPEGRERMLYAFLGGSDGFLPLGALINVNGTLYSTTQFGGSAACYEGCGTVFSVTPAGKEKVLYRFKGGNDGSSPTGTLTYLDGALYGTTSSGGSDGCGTVFEITLAGKETVLFRSNESDGASPSSLIDVGGRLYGTAYAGNGKDCEIGCGSVFTLTK
jgi:uncharacterized repeat protein (TIGR03803 family)